MILGASYLEWSAILTTTACIFLAGRNNVWSWPIGIVAVVLYGILFFNIQLYADATLQIFFVITGLIGWYGWHRSKSDARFKTPNIARVSAINLLLMVLTAVIVAVAYGTVLKAYTNAFAPMVDSLVLTFSVVGQLLLMRRKLETWPVWIIVNTIAVPLFWMREIHLTAIMYAVFWVHAWYAWYIWTKKYSAGE